LQERQGSQAGGRRGAFGMYQWRPTAYFGQGLASQKAPSERTYKELLRKTSNQIRLTTTWRLSQGHRRCKAHVAKTTNLARGVRPPSPALKFQADFNDFLDGGEKPIFSQAVRTLSGGHPLKNCF